MRRSYQSRRSAAALRGVARAADGVGCWRPGAWAPRSPWRPPSARWRRTLDAGGRVKRELVPTDAGGARRGAALHHHLRATTARWWWTPAASSSPTPIPEGTVYVPGSAGGDGTRVEYSTDGETFTAEEPRSPGSRRRPGRRRRSVSRMRGPRRGRRPVRGAEPALDLSAGLAPGRASEVYFHVRMQ